ncbi:MAG: hypothetical protein R2822_08735 [Spirosomataceae bacterium]
MWAYLAGIGGFRPQHFDYFKHNLLLNNLIRFDWPVRYADGTYLCYYHAYYLPAALLAKCWGGTTIAPYYIFGWTWLGLTLLFLLLNQLSGWKFVVFFLFFNSIEALLLLYDMLKSDHSLGFLMKDFWTNDHTIELLQTPGGLMFPSHVASFSAAPQHSLPAWLITAFFIPQNTDKTEPFHLQNRLLPWFLLILCLYWSPLVAIGVVPLATRYSVLATRYSALTTRYSALAMLTLTLLAIPCLIFYAGHLPINELHGWWWEFLTTPHEYALLFTFLTIEVVFWAVIVWFLEKKYQVLEKDKSLIGLALGILFVLTFYRYGHYNDLARRACLPATLILCWGVYRLGSSIPWQTYHFFLLGLVVILPLKDHLHWLTKQPTQLS